MRKVGFILAMLAILLALGMAFVSCDNDTTSGGNTPGGGTPGIFTLTNIPSEYNGKYAYFQGQNASGDFIYGAQNMNGTTGIVTLIPISNGRASFPLARLGGFPYTSTETLSVVVPIYDQSTVMSGNVISDSIAMIQFMNIPFTNGSATKSWADGAVQ